MTSIRLVHENDVVFSREQADAIVDFITQHAEVDRLVVHCAKGRSRSAAVAAFACEMLSGPVNELEARFPDYNRLVRAALAEARARRERPDDTPLHTRSAKP